LKGLVNNAVALSISGKLSFPKLRPLSSVSQPVSTVVDYSRLLQPSGRLPTLKEAEEYLVKEALRASGGTQRTAAVLLGVSRQALNKRLLRDPSIGEYK
jgi:DNA-binding NtrC family response regulator